MSLFINTNIFSLNAQRNLSKSQNSLKTSMERLSSGLRINSAKDDAAGLTISDRMTSQVRGLNQAVRNANDGISLAQTAEGAMQESTNILQRIRELAVQSSNDTNSASDRASIQKEVNQLIQELNRISSDTTYNNTNIIDGTFADYLFQVGANAGENISVSISSVHGSKIGSYQLETLSSVDSTGTGSIHEPTALLPIGYTPTTTNTTGEQILTIYGVSNVEIYVVKGDSAEIVVNKINAVTSSTGVEASARTHTTIDQLSSDGTISFTLETEDGDHLDVSADVTTDNLDAIAAVVNADTATHGFTAQAMGNYIYINRYSDGKDVIVKDFTHSNGDGETIEVSGYDNNANDSILTSGQEDSTIVAGSLDIFSFTNSFSVSSDIDYNNGGSVLDAPADTIINSYSALPWGWPNYVGIQGNPIPDYYTGTTIPPVSSIWTNNISNQEITIEGELGKKTVSVLDGDSASQISSKINKVTNSTGVTASAITEVTLSKLSADGEVTLTFGTAESTFKVISEVISNDFYELSEKINEQGGDFGISSLINNGELVISQKDGDDLRLENFTHEVSNTTIDLKGMNGQTVQLEDSAADSTIVTGSVTMNSCGIFTVSSNIDAADGSIVNRFAGDNEVSFLNQVIDIDVSTFDGAQKAILVADHAICQIDKQRASLGAIQNRFEHTIANLQNISENVSAARSRILDADIAAETAAMTKENILQQAGVSVLAQANQQPQLALSLIDSL